MIVEKLICGLTKLEYYKAYMAETPDSYSIGGTEEQAKMYLQRAIELKSICD